MAGGGLVPMRRVYQHTRLIRRTTWQSIGHRCVVCSLSFVSCPTFGQIQFTWQDVRPVPYAASDMAEIQLMMKTFDDLESTWKRVTETVREHDAQLEKDMKLLAYWEDIHNQIQAHEQE